MQRFAAAPSAEPDAGKGALLSSAKARCITRFPDFGLRLAARTVAWREKQKYNLSHAKLLFKKAAGFALVLGGQIRRGQGARADC